MFLGKLQRCFNNARFNPGQFNTYMLHKELSLQVLFNSFLIFWITNLVHRFIFHLKIEFLSDSLEKIYGHRVRLRVCGILEHDDGLLLIKHKLGPAGELWIPPGGEVQLGESAPAALKREFVEETGLEVEVGDYLFSYEFINVPFHAFEVFFHIKKWSGEISLGLDPETSDQIIEEVKFVSFDELRIMDKSKLHGIFGKVDDPSLVSSTRGFYGSSVL